VGEPVGDGGAGDMKEGSGSFLKKRTKKLFSIWCVPLWRMTGLQGETFFGSFFQKRTTSLLYRNCNHRLNAASGPACKEFVHKHRERCRIITLDDRVSGQANGVIREKPQPMTSAF
jgi:hypothetical protein